MSDLISARVDDGVGHLTLNRPKAINALNLEMIRALTERLCEWADDPEVEAIHLRGSGERGFSAGADIRALAQAVRDGSGWLQILREEYALQRYIGEYPKPIVSYLTGVTMGGGLGLGAPSTRRFVDTSTTMAMPETKIGWFPDAGMMYFLSRAGAVGIHVALASATFGGGDAIRMDIADEAIGDPLPAPLYDQGWIGECYGGSDPVEIVGRLESHADPAAREAARNIRERSPLAVHVALRALRRAATLSHAEVLEQDLDFSSRMLPIDFPEGVRALIVDKDNAPRWSHASLEDVSRAEVDIIVGRDAPAADSE